VRRSVARAIGESKDGAALNILLRLLQDSEWMVRMATTQAMGQMTSARAAAGPALLDRLGKERDGLVFRTTLRALGDLIYPEAIPDLIKVLEVPSRETVDTAMQALYIITGEKYLRREQWIDWYRTRYPDWKKKHPTTR
jgi:HEAT repeat protein